MFRLIRLFRTSIGSKQVLAVAGLALVGFLLIHMIGNLTVYQGPEAMNAYSAWLQGHPLLWAVRLLLLAIFVLHVSAAVRLARANRQARPQRYAVRRYLQAKPASRTMLVSGLIILVFVLYHLSHLTLSIVGPAQAHDAAGRLDVFANVVNGFANPWVAWGYVLALLLLGVHLAHAIQSLFQTLGLTHENYRAVIRFLSSVLALAITAGFVSIPIAVQFGLLGLPAGGAA